MLHFHAHRDAMYGLPKAVPQSLIARDGANKVAPSVSIQIFNGMIVFQHTVSALGAMAITGALRM